MNDAKRKTPDGPRVFLVLWRAARAVQEHDARHVRALGLGASGFAVLEALMHKGPLPVNALGGKVLLTSGSMTAAVDRLEEQGYVVRKDDPEDRRARVVHLTARGEAFIRKAFADHAAILDRAVSSLTASERTELVRLLKKLGHGAAALLDDRKGRDGR